TNKYLRSCDSSTEMEPGAIVIMPAKMVMASSLVTSSGTATKPGLMGSVWCRIKYDTLTPERTTSARTTKLSLTKASTRFSKNGETGRSPASCMTTSPMTKQTTKFSDAGDSCRNIHTPAMMRVTTN